jgi:hypothetical protein
MPRMPFALRIRRSRTVVLAAAFLAAAQFAVAVVAPVLDADAAASAPAHVEAFGIHLHFAHNPDDCAACVAQSIVAVAPALAPAHPALAAAHTEFASRAPIGAERDGWRPDVARAPPRA